MIPSRKGIALDERATDTAALFHAIEDWSVMVSAVSARLKRAADELLSGAGREGAVHRVAASLVDCTEALDQLHDAQVHEIVRRQQRPLDAFDARLAFAQARAQLGGLSSPERRSRRVGFYDALTGLPNDRFFCERVDHWLGLARQDGESVSLMVVAFDGLGAVGEEHGVQISDELLAVLATRLKRAVRAVDVLARVGETALGCLLVEPLERAALATLVQRVASGLQVPVQVGDAPLKVVPRIGIAESVHGGDLQDTAEVLLARAHAAVRQARAVGQSFGFQDRG